MDVPQLYGFKVLNGVATQVIELLKSVDRKVELLDEEFVRSFHDVEINVIKSLNFLLLFSHLFIRLFYRDDLELSVNLAINVLQDIELVKILVFIL